MSSQQAIARHPAFLTLVTSSQPQAPTEQMLSYQHSYHAGNPADVVKHTLLIQCLKSMQSKDNPLFYLETHAGRGVYDLTDADAQKTSEFVDGIGRLWNESNLPEPLAEYRKQVERLNSAGMLERYPGSPKLSAQLLRRQDRMLLCELHPGEHEKLDFHLGGARGVTIARQNGYHALEKLLPPRERRGLIMIDPAYELANEFITVWRGLQTARERFANGVYLLWYPLVGDSRHQVLQEKFASQRDEHFQVLEFVWNENNHRKAMYGCGVLAINWPWSGQQRLAQTQQALTDWCAQLSKR